MRRIALNQGFTIVELLVVIVILGVLAATLMPVVGKFLSSGDDVVSRNNLMRLGRAAIAFRSEESHENCYPSAGGSFSAFSWRDPNTRARERRYGRARGWVYFEHDCPRSKGDEAAKSKIGDGNCDSYGLGGMKQNAGEDDSGDGTYVNEEGCCICFDSKKNEGGIGSKPAGWQEKSSDMWSKSQVAIMNGCLYDYLGRDLRVFSNPAFEKQAVQKLGVPRNTICRAYAMNVITGADKDLYDTGRSGYSGSGDSRWAAIRYGQDTLKPYIDASKRGGEAMAARTALFVELDLDNSELKKANALGGDQVWDWDGGDEIMGFAHEDNGMMFAHVCFADGHVEAIRDPSPDPTKPNDARRLKLSKWYGSGGLNASGEKLD